MPAFVSNHLDWFVSGLIVVLGLLVYGLADLLRTRPGRIWAIGTVCFRDAIRRRVLWITPLAMLGIVLVSQFQKPFDELDAVRITIKVCLFTTGLVVTIIALVTAATNLPREIDNRVIFTIVTKPVSRLEIVLGKIVGFARVSAVMLLVMGAFTLIYLHAQAWYLGRGIDEALASGGTQPIRRVWLQHYRDQGLLQAQSIARPNILMQYARIPDREGGGWLLGGAQDALVHLELAPKDLVSEAGPDKPAGAFGIGFLLKIGYEPVRSAAGPTSQPTVGPQVAIQLLDPATGTVLIAAEQLGRGASPKLTDPTGDNPVLVQIAPEVAVQIASRPSINVQMICPDGGFLYHIKPDAVTLVVPDSETKQHYISSKQIPILRGNTARSGQQLLGPGRGVQPVAVYVFRDAVIPAARNGRVPFELNVAVDPTGNEADREVVGTLEVRAQSADGKLSPPTVVYPESRRTVFFELPDEFLKSGNFDIHVRNRTNGHTIGLQSTSVSMIAGTEYFGINLLKALVVLWLLAILTATVAFWCSTFLSWPIAVVLSSLAILGHWGVSNVDLGSGIGAAVATDFVGSNSAELTKVVSSSVEKLSRTLTLVASVLPDITAFGVTDRVEKGTSLTVGDLISPVAVLVMFGLPLVTLSYVFLRNKEVAP